MPKTAKILKGLPKDANGAQVVASAFGAQTDKFGWPHAAIAGGFVLFAAIAAVTVLVLSGGIDFPKMFTRDFSTGRDRRILEKAFAIPLPASFKIEKVHLPSFENQRIDQLNTAFYQIELDAADLPALTSRSRWSRVRDYEFARFGNEAMAMEYFDKPRYDALARGSAALPPASVAVGTLKDAETYRLFLENSLTEIGSLAIDESTSPRLKLYLATQLPYQPNWP